MEESLVSSGLPRCSSPWECLTVPRFSSGPAPYVPVTCSLGCVCPLTRCGRAGSWACCGTVVATGGWVVAPALVCAVTRSVFPSIGSWGSQLLLWASVQGRLLSSAVPPGCGIP